MLSNVALREHLQAYLCAAGFKIGQLAIIQNTRKLETLANCKLPVVL